MKRRQFIRFIVGAAASLPRVARAQQTEQIRRIGVLFPLSSDDPEVKVRLNAFISALKENGWEEGRSIVFDIRYGDGSSDRILTEAAAMIRSQPDVILASGTQAATALRQQHGNSLSYSSMLRTQSPEDSLRAWRDQGGT